MSEKNREDVKFIYISPNRDLYVENERLRNELDDAINKAYEEFAKYEADIERLKAERDEWRAVCTEDYEPRMGKLQAVVDAARHLLAGGDKEAVYHLERAIAALEQEK